MNSAPAFSVPTSSGSGVLLATAPFAASASFTQTGLGANTAHVLRVAGGNENGDESYPLPMNLKLGVGVPYGNSLLWAFDLLGVSFKWDAASPEIVTPYTPYKAAPARLRAPR